MASKAFLMGRWSSSLVSSHPLSPSNKSLSLRPFSACSVSFTCKTDDVKFRPLRLIRAHATGDNKRGRKDIPQAPGGTNNQGTAIPVQRPPRGLPAGISPSPSGVMDSFSPTKRIRQMLDTIEEQLGDALWMTLISPAGTWEIHQNDDGEIKMRFNMPELSKDDVYVAVEEDDDVLVIEGDLKGKANETTTDSVCYNTRLKLPQDCDKDMIKAEWNSGVLLISIPKARGEGDYVIQDIKID